MCPTNIYIYIFHKSQRHDKFINQGTQVPIINLETNNPNFPKIVEAKRA